MEREIKFRAWDNDRKKMIYSFADKLNMKAYVLLWSTDNDRLFCGNYMDNGDWQEPELMQFTGLHDKNGKEVFEFDVLECDGYRVLIVFRGGQFVGFNPNLPIPETHNRNWLQWRVIGNQFETPELLNFKN